MSTPVNVAITLTFCSRFLKPNHSGPLCFEQSENGTVILRPVQMRASQPAAGAKVVQQ